MPRPHSTDTQDRSGSGSAPRSRKAGGRKAGGESSGSADDAMVQGGGIPGVLELAQLLETRIAGMCRELEEKSERIEELERDLAERESRLKAARRELEASRAQLAEASQREAIAEAAVGDSPKTGRRSVTEEPADPREKETAREETERPEPPAEATDLVAAAMTRQKAEHSEDQAELDACLSELSHWATRVDTLREGLAPTALLAAAELKECGGAFESLPPELQDVLRGRHEGLELIGKMIDRLLQRLPELGEPPERSLPLIGEEDWAALLAGETNREAADQRIRQKLEELSSKRYKSLGQKRQLVETGRQSLLQFLRAQVLPVLDGIEDGEKHSRELIARLKTEDQDSEESLDTWYRAYETLRAELLGVLDQIEVRPLEVRCGEPIDYNCQEPFGVEADPDLNTEDVKAVTRTGYELAMDESEETFVLRPAQVIVVKNPKESNRA